MLTFLSRSRRADRKQILAALDRAQAVIEFRMDGTITSANAQFLKVMGYSADEVIGRKHAMFMAPGESAGEEYRRFWERLNSGEHQVAQFRRLGKDGREIWIQGSYNPVLDRHGKPYKVIKIASDITSQTLMSVDHAGQIAAIGNSQAVIHFDMDGTIITANDNFLSAVGYTLEEIQHRHHRMFVESAYAGSREYARFWENLRRGEYQSGAFRRLGKDGREVWIQATYTPICDPAGRPFKVVKYASDITAQVHLREKREEALRTISESLARIEQAISDASGQAAAAANASSQTSENVSAVAAGAEELNLSVREIAESMARSRVETDEAAEQTAIADQATQRLAKAAESMGGILDLIQTIAGQINLLALNATIESARAGEAGRGFAVVANEVKTLAKQAADAADRIAREIEGVQAISNEVVEGLSTIRRAVATVREYVASTAGAVEQQSAVAREMSANMQAASLSVSDISSNVVQIATATRQAETSTRAVRDASRALSA